VAQLSEWLELMLAEIARKQDDERRALEEEQRRTQEQRTAPRERTVAAR
jgi:hypothetical protein